MDGPQEYSLRRFAIKPNRHCAGGLRLFAVHQYYEREVSQQIPDIWIDGNKTGKGYEISFSRICNTYPSPHSMKEITAKIFELEKETEGILNEIVND